jgi:hypothetical protein
MKFPLTNMAVIKEESSMPDYLDMRTSLALGRDAVITTNIADLAGEQGVPLSLEKGDQQAIVLNPVPCCGHSATSAVPPEQTGGIQPHFDTAEHAIIVWGLKLQTEAGLLDAAKAALPVATDSNFALTYGQFIALGGDFYGDPDHPVCTSPSPVLQFWKNFNSMVNARAEVQAILAVASRYEFGPISSAVGQNRQPSGVYAALPTTPPHWVSDEDRAFDEATGGTPIQNGRYLNLAFTNFDHFGLDAISCYRTGHALAQATAAKAKAITDPNARAKALLNAYAINAFADHFLTDLFAAGHMRTPRRKLFETAANYVTQVGAGLCAKQMHDEDNKFGVWVTNAVGDSWVAYGDARYRDTWNSAGRVMVKAAVQASMDDIWQSFTHGAMTDPNATAPLRYTASVITEIAQPATGQRQRDDQRNWAPLFWWDPNRNVVMRRDVLFDPGNRAFCDQGFWPSQWGITTTVAQLEAAKFPVYMPRNMYPGTFPPNETGATGQYGWPPVPGSMTGPLGATGPTLRGTPWSWGIDGAPGPTQIPPG